ncbi:hypothetical protein FJW07_14050 [Mesorhizobium sp. B3-1-9]|uniref:hypothetical protein n=1 Tax=Mesorhizobium sp. B3-1-9 TaxID=2589892 RepID=UPI0011299885|nr:hypothetical protein [Mesorhizobium sp. B3-1-9]TPI39299.1 hypothetical protein FJW07_14050 [Mesorhizobium sp. B3-1-9]
MNAHALSPDATRLKAIKVAIDALGPCDWTRAHDETGALIEARGDYGERYVLARFGDHASVDEVAFVCGAPDTVRFLLHLLARAFSEIHELRGEPVRRNKPVGEPAADKNFAAECALKCQDARFKVYLEERHGLERPLTDDRVAQRVRSILGVTSRKQLNDGGAPAEAWKALRADFAAWLKAGR